MTRLPTARSTVEQFVIDLFGTDVAVDEDGDVTVRWDRALLFVGIVDRDAGAFIRVRCPMLHGIPATPALLAEIDRLDREILDGRMYWDDAQVVVATELGAATANSEALGRACRTVAGVADRFDARLREAVLGT